MEYKGIKINIVILIIAVVLMIFFAGKFIMTKYNVEQPLLESINNVNGIENVELIDSNGKINIKITVTDDADFYQTYKNVVEITETQLAEDKGNVLINNKTSPALNDIYHKIHFSIYEGIATSQFTKMNSEIEEIAQTSGLKDFKVWIDNNNLYLKMSDGDNYLYKIISRITKNTGVGGEVSG